MRTSERDSTDSIDLKGVLISFGLIAEGHAQGYRAAEGLQIEAIVEPNDERQREAAHVFPNAAIVASLDHLELAHFDFMDVCAPPAFHLPYVASGLEAGLPVLCEKPLVLGEAEIEELKSLEKRWTGGFVYPSHNYSYAPAMRVLFELLDSRLAGVGSPTSGHIRTLRTGHAKGVSEWRPDWRRDPHMAGGGILQDHGPHALYIAMRAVGTPVHSVRCTLGFEGEKFTETEELAILELRFSCGSEVTIELDWASPVRQSCYMFKGPWGFVRLIDDAMSACIDGIYCRDSVVSEFNDPRHGAWFAEMLQDFRSACDRPSRAELLRSEAENVTRVISAGYESNRSNGREVLVEAGWLAAR